MRHSFLWMMHLTGNVRVFSMGSPFGFFEWWLSVSISHEMCTNSSARMSGTVRKIAAMAPTNTRSLWSLIRQARTQRCVSQANYKTHWSCEQSSKQYSFCASVLTIDTNSVTCSRFLILQHSKLAFRGHIGRSNLNLCRAWQLRSHNDAVIGPHPERAHKVAVVGKW